MNSILASDELEYLLGDNIRKVRLQKDLTLQDVAQRAGVSLTALRNLEGGKGATISTMVKVLRSLNKESWLRSLAPTVTINPLQMVRGQPVRLRASGRKSKLA